MVDVVNNARWYLDALIEDRTNESKDTFDD